MECPVAGSQSPSTQDFTSEIYPDLFLCNKTRNIRTKVTLSPRHLTKETGKLTSLQPRLKLIRVQVLGGGWYNPQNED